MPKLGLTSEPTSSSQGGMMAAVIIAASTPAGGGGVVYKNYYSVDFDGTNDYVNIGDVLDQDGTSAFSMSFWVNLDTLAGHIVGKMLNSGTYAGYAAYINGNKLRFAIINSWSGNALAVDTVDDFATGSWKHVVITYDGGQDVSDVKIYINGSSQTLTTIHNTLSSSSSTTAPFTIGARNGNALYLNGKTDEVAFFDSELSASDVTAIYNSGVPDSLASQSNLKEWYRMGDGANYPIVKNQAHFSQTAVEFDGSNDYVDMGNILPFERDEEFSISAWVYLTNTSTTTTFFIAGKFQNSGNYSGYALYAYNYKLHFVLRGNSDMVATSAANLTPNQWHHILGTYDGSDTSSGIKTYINGSLDVASQTGSTGISILSDTPFIIGSRAGGSLPFQGNIDDVSVYSTELSSSDVTDIYNSGYPKDESERSGLLSYYKFDGDVYPVVRDETEFSNASLDFDGTNDYIVVPNTSDFDYGTGDFCWSFWLNYEAHTNYAGILETGSTNSEYRLKFQTSGQYLFMQNANGDSQVADLGTNITSTGWHHILLNRVSGTIYTYLDGAQVDSDVRSGNVNSNGEDLNIAFNGVSNTFTGKMNNIALWKGTSLSASDIATVYNSGKPADISSLNPTNWWKLGDDTTPLNTPSALGYGTHSVDFDGTNDYVTMGDVLDQDGGSAFSLSAWVYFDGTSDYSVVGKQNSSGNFNGYGIQLYSSKLRFAAFNSLSSRIIVDTSSALSSGQWYHLAATYDGSKDASGVTLYVDGSAVGMTTVADTLSSNSTTSTALFSIGSRNGVNQFIDGRIKQVGIFNTELSASDVTSIYNSGLPKDISSESGLVSYYRMGDGEDKYPNILDYKGTAHGTMTNMASDDITTANVGSGVMFNMDLTSVVADSPSGTSGQMTNMASDDFVGAKGTGTMTNMTDTDITTTTP